MRRRGRKILEAALAGFFLAGVAAQLGGAGPSYLPLDDAYITLHSAGALLAGGDRNYPGTPPLHGITSAPHLLLVSLALRLGLPGIDAVHLVAWLAALAYALGLARLAAISRLPPALAAAFVLAGLTAGWLPYHLFNGLETGLALAGATWALVAATDPAPRRRWALPALAGLLPWLRPELALLSLLLLTTAALPGRRDGERADPRPAAWAAPLAIAGAVALPWALWHLAATGAPLPTSGAIKASFYAQGCWPVTDRLVAVWRELALFFPGILGLGLAFLPATRLGAMLLVFVAGFFLTYAALFPQALGFQGGRYLQLLVPVAAWGALTGLRHSRRWVRRAAAGVVIAAAAQGLLFLPGRIADLGESRAWTATAPRDAIERIAAVAPRDATVLVHDAGYAAYGSDLRLVDLVGLKTPAAATLHREITAPSCGARRGEAIAVLAAREEPRFLVTLPSWDRRFGLTASLASHGWGLEPLGEPRAGYAVYRLSPVPAAAAQMSTAGPPRRDRSSGRPRGRRSGGSPAAAPGGSRSARGEAGGR